MIASGSGQFVVGAFGKPTTQQQTDEQKVDAKPLAASPALEDYFEKPVAITDADGQTILTRKGNGHPVVVDWNHDGKNDLILGAKGLGRQELGKRELGIYFFENVGSNKAPTFNLPPIELGRFEDGSEFCLRLRMNVQWRCRSPSV